MKTHLKTLALGATIVGALATAPALYAQSYLSMSHGSMMGERMIGDSAIMGMMGGMMNMMGMSGDTGDMMEQCGRMMQAMDDGKHPAAQRSVAIARPRGTGPTTRIG